jgi:outer membrane protein
MKLSRTIRITCTLALIAIPTAQAGAQTAPTPDPDPVSVPDTPKKSAPSDWQFSIGAGTGVSPAFLGSKTYQIKAAPFAEVRYKDRFFLSVFDGAGFDLIKTGGFRAGPVVTYDSGRKEDGKSIFRVAGSRDDSLIGLGDVKGAVAAGGFAEYQMGHFSAKAQVTKAFGGDNGVLANIGARYATPLPIFPYAKRPVIFSIGPRAVIVDDKYNNAYFGVTGLQSTRSGLPQYTAKGGLQSYGVGTTILVPLSKSLTATMLAGYDRLSGDAANSPLVKQRGSANQASVGMGLIYHFGK